MAINKAGCSLMHLPLEVRHTIFEFSATRPVKPKKLLRYWFEKEEAKELIAQKIAADPSAPAPRAVYHNEYDEDSDVPEQEDGPDSASEDDEDDEDGEDNENDGDSEDESEAEDDDMLQDEDEDEDEADDMEDDDDDEAADGAGLALAQNTIQLHTSGQAQSLPVPTVQAQNQSADTNQQPDEDEMEDGNDEEDSDYDAQDDGDATGTVAAPLPQPVPVVHVSHKWRHVPNFMRITHCPPPAELLMASKQLNHEAKDWFYDVAVLRINATGSFAHTSFFEETFRQITEAAFSPMENVRKVEMMFVWDTTWLRADETSPAPAIFPALLRQRSDFVYQASDPVQSAHRQTLTSSRFLHRLLTSGT
jgi:hypothetical protein